MCTIVARTRSAGTDGDLHILTPTCGILTASLLSYLANRRLLYYGISHAPISFYFVGETHVAPPIQLIT